MRYATGLLNTWVLLAVIALSAGAARTQAQIVPLQPRAGGPCKTVFGYLPYWKKTSPQRYDLLTHVAHFSVGANAGGTLSNSINWPSTWTTQINAAHQAGVKVILTVTQFDPATTLTLITTPASKSAFFSNITAMLIAGQADGVNIDFEGSGTYTSYINQFMADLTAHLHAAIPGCEITFAGPAVNWSTWNLPGLADSCDGVFIMGYAFWGSWSNTSGPNAPLTGGSYNITNTVYTQYRNTDRGKLILGLPYYGHHWKTATSSPRSSVVDFISSVTFSVAQAESEQYERLWDATSQTPWYRWHDGTNWNQVWYDDATSLGLKYQLAVDAGLQGVGMWCLGNDSGRDELWDLLEQKFIVGCRQPWDALVVGQSFPTTMIAGTTATGWIEFQNTGSQEWLQGEVNLGTWNPQDRTSPFYTAGEWPSPQRPADMDIASCPWDSTCRFTFTLTAPDTVGVHDESIRLVKEGTAWFGPQDLHFQITVTPRPVPGDFDGDLDVDQEDFGHLQQCQLGDMTPQTDPACTDATLNGDPFVDYRDVSIFIGCMTSPGVAGDRDCAN